MFSQLVVVLGLLCCASAFRLTRNSAFRSSLQATWQQEVDKLLNIDTSLEDRKDLSKSVFGKLGEITGDLVDAVQTQNLKKVAPKNLAYGKAIYGLRDFRQQLVSDVIPEFLRKGVPKIVEEAPKVVGKIVAKGPEEWISSGRRVASQLQEVDFEEVKREVRNIYKSTPDGLETPPYTVLALREYFEIRSYAPYSLASTTMTPEDDQDVPFAMDPLPMAASFCTLNDYFTTKNGRGRTVEVMGEDMGMGEGMGASTVEGAGMGEGAMGGMEGTGMGEGAGMGGMKDVPSEAVKLSMTMPVVMGEESMSFVLPHGLTASTAPRPTDSSVTLSDVGAQTVAAREFTGLITEAEVARQRARLEDSLILEGVIYDNPSFRVLSYNSPLTPPWLRRNEVSFVVTLSEDFAVDMDLEEVADVIIDAEVVETVVAGADVDDVDDQPVSEEEGFFESSPEAGD